MDNAPLGERFAALLTDPLFWFTAVFLAVIVSVASNLLTDKIKDWNSKRSLVSRRKRADQLRSELDRQSLWQENFSLLISYAFVLITFLVGFGIAAATLTISGILISYNQSGGWGIPVLALGLGLFFSFFQVTYTIVTTMRQFVRYDIYKQETEKRIAELEAAAGQQKQQQP